MKKLMTMIAAVGMAFGLFAETDLPSSTSFESADEFTDGKLSVGDGTKWTCEDYDAATLSQTQYEPNEAYPYSGTARYKFSDTEPDPQDYYLTIKTAFDKPLTRSFTDAAAADKAPVYIDQLVKFTAADEDMEIADTSAKIGVWAKETYAEDGETVTGAKLFVTAGPVVNSKPTIYDLGTIEVEAWHRLTIKAIKAQTAGTDLGYEVFVDGVALAADKAGYSDVSGLTVQAQALNAAKKIFPAMVTGLDVLALGIAGQGAIDDMMATTEKPGEWAEDKMIKFGYTADFTKIVYTVHGAKSTIDNITEAGFVSIPYASDMRITIDTAATTLKTDYIIKGVSGTGATYDNGVITVAEGADFVLEGKDNAQRIKIGNNYYANFKDAIDAIKEGAPATLVLQQAVEVGANGSMTEANFSGINDVTIDLNGQTITGTATGVAGFVITCAGNLTITNSQATGGIAKANDTLYAGVVGVSSPDANDRKLTIYGGQFDGAVVARAGTAGMGNVTSEVSGGSFLKSANAQPGTEGGLTIADGFKLGASAGDYWEVVAKAKYTISVTGAANAVVTINEEEVKSLELTEGEDYEIVVTPNANYEYKADGTYDPFEFNEGTLTMSGRATATAAFAAADATAKEYTISIANGGDDASVNPAVYTYNVATDVTLDAGTKAGYEVDTWTAPADCTITGNTLTIPVGVSGDLTATVTWKATTYTITAVNGTVDGQAPYTYTIDTFQGEDLELALAADAPASGKQFKEWTITPATEGVSIDDPTSADEAILTIVNGILANFTVEATYEDEGGVPVDPTDPPATEDGEENLALLNSLLGENAAAWVADVYGEGGSVPGSKLDDSTPELIAAAAEYNLKVMASPVTITPAATTDGKFTFAISDADKANPVVAATLAQELMVYTSDLKVDFARDAEGAAVEAEVSGDLIEVGFTGEDLSGETANAGFMKVDLTVED